jgi:hypothetical protein
MPRLLGLLVFLIGLAAIPAEARDRWPPKARHCDAFSWFCAGPRGLEFRGPPRSFGVPHYARPDRHLVPPRFIRPRWHTRPGIHHRKPQRHGRPGFVICDPGRGICFPLRPPQRRSHGFAWRGIDDSTHRLFRPERPAPHSRFRSEWR